MEWNGPAIAAGERVIARRIPTHADFLFQEPRQIKTGQPRPTSDKSAPGHRLGGRTYNRLDCYPRKPTGLTLRATQAPQVVSLPESVAQ